MPADAGVLVNVSAHEFQLAPRGCFIVPVAFTAAEVGTPITRTVRLSGPSPVPFERYAGPEFREVSLRGSTADLVAFPSVDDDMRQLRWTEPDNRSWLLETFGLSDAELLRVATNLGLDDPTVSVGVGWLPPAIEIVYEHAADTPVPSKQRTWYAGWMNHEHSDADRLQLSVSEQAPDIPPIAWLQGSKRLRTRLVPVRGVVGVATSEVYDSSGEVIGELSWEEAPGITVRLVGYYDVETLLRIAGSLETVTTDDERLRD